MEISLFFKYLEIFSGCPSSRESILEDDFDTIFIACFIDKESSGVLSSICCNFCFLGFLSLAPTGFLRFKRGIDSFATMLPFFL